MAEELVGVLGLDVERAVAQGLEGAAEGGERKRVGRAIATRQGQDERDQQRGGACHRDRETQARGITKAPSVP